MTNNNYKLKFLLGKGDLEKMLDKFHGKEIVTASCELETYYTDIPSEDTNSTVSVKLRKGTKTNDGQVSFRRIVRLGTDLESDKLSQTISRDLYCTRLKDAHGKVLIKSRKSYELYPGNISELHTSNHSLWVSVDTYHNPELTITSSVLEIRLPEYECLESVRHAFSRGIDGLGLEEVTGDVALRSYNLWRMLKGNDRYKYEVSVVKGKTDINLISLNNITESIPVADMDNAHVSCFYNNVSIGEGNLVVNHDKSGTTAQLATVMSSAGAIMCNIPDGATIEVIK